MRNRKEDGPDKGWSWVIVSAACINTFLLMGIMRASSVLFIEFIDEFHVSREEASWPLTLCISIRNLTGLIAGPLGKRFGVRSITIIGALVATIGLSCCYMTTSFNVITMLFGIVFGIGYGFIGTLTCIIVNEYFLNYRTFAIGIASCGSCVGSAVFPVLFLYLINKYGLSGCFLLAGGFLLHITVTGSLMRPALWLQKLKSTSCTEDKDKSNSKLTGFFLNSNVINECSSPNLKDTSKFFSSLKTYGAIYSNINVSGTELSRSTKEYERTASSFKSVEFHCMENKSYYNAEAANVHNSILKTENGVSSKSECSFRNNKSFEFETNILEDRSYVKLINEFDLEKPEKHSSKTNIQFSCENFNATKSSNLKKSVKKSLSCTIFTHANRTSNALEQWKRHLPTESKNANPFYNMLKSFKSVLTKPIFYIICCTSVSYFFQFHTFNVIIMDYLLDGGIPTEKSKHVLTAFAVFDFVGRLCVGWITDRKLIRRSHYVMGCMALTGITFFSFPFVNGYTWFIVVTCFYGLLQGCTMVIFPVLHVDYFGLELQAIASGCVCFIYGIASFIRPVLIGYFRDDMGSYTNIFYILGSFAFISSLLWPLEKYCVKNDESEI